MSITLAFALLAALALGVAFGRVSSSRGRAPSKEAVKPAPEEIERLSRERDAALELAEGAERTRRTIISNLNHEFRTPLNSVIGFADLLLADEGDADRREMLALVKESGWRLLRLVNEVVHVAELARNDEAACVEDFDCRRLLDGLAERVSARASAKGVELSVECACGRRLCGNLESLERLLRELLDNAVKFTAKGGVALRARELTVSDGEKAIVEFQVADTGPGIDPAYLAWGPAPLTLAQDYLTKSHEGLGMGLYLAQRLSERLRGDLRIESDPETGTRIYFIAPFELEGARKDRA